MFHIGTPDKNEKIKERKTLKHLQLSKKENVNIKNM